MCSLIVPHTLALTQDLNNVYMNEILEHFRNKPTEY